MNIGNGQFWRGDCLELMRQIPDASVDMILCDLPYGTTQNKWDSLIPFEPLWAHYWRVAKPNAAIVLTAAQPFTSALVMSQVEYFKYEWIWHKSRATGHLNAKKMPMREHESICVFGKGSIYYEPQMYNKTKGFRKAQKSVKSSGSYGDVKEGIFREVNEELAYPKSVQKFNDCFHDREAGLHPTQKPVDLFAYLIRTYTQPGQIVLDNCAGSGTTAIAAERERRKWLCIEQDETYYNAACGRVWKEVLKL